MPQRSIIVVAIALAACHVASPVTPRGSDVAAPPRDPCRRHLVVTRQLADDGVTPEPVVVERIERLVALWRALPPPAQQRCRVEVAELVERRALVFHERANEREGAARTRTLELSQRLFEVYLAAFPEPTAELGEHEYAYAMLLWSRASDARPGSAEHLWERAALAYGRVATGRRVDDMTERHAAQAAVLCWRNSTWKSLTPSTHTGAPRPEALDERERGLLRALDVYGALLDPSDEERNVLAHLAARVLLHRDRVAEAEARLRPIFDGDRDRSHWPEAGALLVEVYRRLGRADAQRDVEARLRAP